MMDMCIMIVCAWLESKLVLKGSTLHVFRCHVMFDVLVLHTNRGLFIFENIIDFERVCYCTSKLNLKNHI